MNNIISIKNLSFSYKEKLIFENLNLNIQTGSWTTIIGPNGGGKSTLIKLILGLIHSNGQIEINQSIMTEQTRKSIYKEVGVLFENVDALFVSDTVLLEMAFVLENLGKTPDYIDEKVKEVAKYLNIEKLLDKNPFQLSGGEKQLVALASVLVAEPKIIILDEALSRIDNKERNNVLKILKKLQIDKKTTIINVTHDIEESLYSDDIILIDHGKIILKGKKELVFKEEKIFNQIGIDIPFLASLSNKLIFYNLLEDIILNEEEMINKLWK